jgi:WD40 repeat protein
MRRAWLVLFSPLLWGQAAYPPDKPFLQIETGMHTASIDRIDIDAAGRYLVSASNDKTARVWDVRDGRLLKILRPPHGDGFEGRLYAVAISPDGATVAVGGFTGPNGSSDFPVYVFDRAAGALRVRVTGLPNVTKHLAYSPDGRYLVAALGGKNGVRIFESGSYRQVASDTNYGTDSYWAEFDQSGRLVTASWDGKVRLYERDFRLPPIAKQIPGGKQPFSARFSPDGTRIAVGFKDSTAVSIVSAGDLSPLPAPGIDVQGGSLNTVAWAPDGKQVCAGGRYGTRGEVPILCWDSVRFGPASTLASAADSVMDLRFLQDGRLAFASAEPEMGLLHRNGSPVWPRKLAGILDLGIRADGLRLDAAGDAVEFNSFRFDGNALSRHLLRFVPESHQLLTVEKFSGVPATTTGLSVKNWDDMLNPTLDGQRLELEDNERSRSLAIATKADRFILGAEWSIRIYDRAGKQQRRIPAPEVAFAVNLTPDARYIVAAVGDGTIRWYEMDTGKEVLALFVHRDLKRWVAWTPEGFFDASPEGESLIGYHLNRGPDHEGEFVKVEQLFDTFYRPDLISRRLKPGGAEAVAAALAKAGRIDDILAGGLAPDIRILNTSLSAEGEVTIQYRLEDRGGGIGNVVARVDRAPVAARTSGIPSVGTPLTITLPSLAPGARSVSVSAKNRSGKLENTSDPVPLNVPSRSAGSNLYVLAVGVSNYRDAALKPGVQFAVNDATLIAQRLQDSARRVFDQVYPEVLADPAGREQIETKIASVVAKLRATDGLVLYLAGHGTVVNGEYYFLPANAQNTSEAALKATALSRERLEKLLVKIPGNRTLLLVDTCSGGALVQEHDVALDAIDRIARSAKRSVLAGAASGKMALEGSNNHGVFTDVLLAGLSGAQADPNGNILVGRLGEFVQQGVPQITRRWGVTQQPEAYITGDLSFALARR